MSEQTPIRNDVITVVGERIMYVVDQEIRDLIWSLTEEAYNMGVQAGKSYARHMIAFDLLTAEGTEDKDKDKDSE